MSTKNTFLLALVFSLILSACGPAKIALTADDNGGQIEVKAGDLIVISLEGNPSTGYSWEAIDLDTSIFEQVGEPEFKAANPDLVGSIGTQTITYKTLQAGTATLILVYHRSWETDVEPLDTFSIVVTIN